MTAICGVALALRRCGVQRGDDQDDDQGDPAHIGLFQPAEHGHGDALVHSGFDKGHGEHQTPHDEPGGIGPVKHGHVVAVHDTGHQGDHADAEGHHGQRNRFGHEAQHHEQHDAHRGLDVKSGLSGLDLFRVGQFVEGEDFRADHMPFGEQ